MYFQYILIWRPFPCRGRACDNDLHCSGVNRPPGFNSAQCECNKSYHELLWEAKASIKAWNNIYFYFSILIVYCSRHSFASIGEEGAWSVETQSWNQRFGHLRQPMCPPLEQGTEIPPAQGAPQMAVPVLWPPTTTHPLNPWWNMYICVKEDYAKKFLITLCAWR